MKDLTKTWGIKIVLLLAASLLLVSVALVSRIGGFGSESAYDFKLLYVILHDDAHGPLPPEEVYARRLARLETVIERESFGRILISPRLHFIHAQELGDDRLAYSNRSIEDWIPLLEETCTRERDFLRYPGLLPRLGKIRSVVHGRAEPGLQLPSQEIPLSGDLSRSCEGRGRRTGGSAGDPQDPSRVRIQSHLPGEPAFESAGMEHRPSEDEDPAPGTPGRGIAHHPRQTHHEGARVPAQERLRRGMPGQGRPHVRCRRIVFFVRTATI